MVTVLPVPTFSLPNVAAPARSTSSPDTSFATVRDDVVAAFVPSYALSLATKLAFVASCVMFAVRPVGCETV